VIWLATARSELVSAAISPVPNRCCQRRSIPAVSGCHTDWARWPAAVVRTAQSRRGGLARRSAGPGPSVM